MAALKAGKVLVGSSLDLDGPGKVKVIQRKADGNTAEPEPKRSRGGPTFWGRRY